MKYVGLSVVYKYARLFNENEIRTSDNNIISRKSMSNIRSGNVILFELLRNVNAKNQRDFLLKKEIPGINYRA